MADEPPADKILVFYGSYRTSRIGIRMANFVIAELRTRGVAVELIDAREVGLPLLDRGGPAGAERLPPRRW